MIQIKCPKCGSVFVWNGADAVAVCGTCGTNYGMTPRKNTAPVLMPPVGRGAVDYLTVPGDQIINNRPLLKTYIPKNWNYQCGLLNDRFDLVTNPFVFSVNFAAPDRSAEIVFTAESFYKHFDLTPQTAQFQNRLEDLTVTRTPTFFRLKSYMTSDSYCDALARSCGLSQISVVDTKQADSEELSKQQRIIQNFLSNGYQDAAAGWSGKTYRGISANGQRMMVYAETRVIQLLKTSVVPTMQMSPYGMGGMFGGMRMMPQMINQERQDIFWDTQYEFVLLATEEAYQRSYAELERIMKTLDYLPGIEDARRDAMQLANNTLMNIANTRADSFARQQQIISNTNAYTSNIHHQMMADNAASHDRSANLNSEMIRGVNTYYANGGIAEASTMYDHVYQNTRDPDIFAAQQGDAFEFGVDFVELRKTNGNY